MNKTILAITFLSLCLLFAISTGACTLEVFEDLVIVGNGTIDRDIRVQSSPCYAGQKLTETIYSAHGRPSSSSYMSSLEFIHSNNSTIYYESDSTLSNVKHYASNKNYRLGISTGFYFIGDQEKYIAFESSPSLSEVIVKSDAIGRSVICAKVVNLTQHHAREVDMVTWLEGNYSIDWNFLAMDVEFPEAGDDQWLVCPGGATFP